MAGKKSIPQPVVHVSEETRKVIVYILTGLCLWSLLQLLFAHIDLPALWGLANFHYLPPTLSIGLAGLSLAGLATGFLRSSSAKRSTKAATRVGAGTWILGALVVIVLGIVFLEVQVAWPFLGDGTSYMGMLYNFRESGTITTQRTATPSLYILYGVYHLYLKISSSTVDSFFPFTFLGFAAGMIFTITGLRFAIAFSGERWQQVLLFMLLMTLAGSLFFFGYVEVYPLQYAGVLVYAYVGYQYVRDRATLLTVGLVLGTTILLHLQNLLLVPSFFLLASVRHSTDRTHVDIRKTAKRIMLFALPILVIGYILTQTVLLDLLTDAVGSPFIPFTAEGDARYTLFSARHLLDLLNYHLLIAAIPLVIIVAGIAGGYAKLVRRDPYVLFLVVNIFFIEAFLIGGGFSFGLGRDWDVCASLGIFLAVFAARLLRERLVDAGGLRRIAIPISVVSLCSAIAWITLNVNMTSSVSRYRDLLSLYAPSVEKKITSRGYENLRKYQQRTDVAGELVTIRTMLELYPTPADARQGMVVLSNQGGFSESSKAEVLRILDIIELLDDTTLRRVEFDKVRVGDPRSEQAATLGDFFSEYIIFLHNPAKGVTLEEALQRTERFVRAHPELPYGHETYGYFLMTYAQRASEAVPYLERAVRLDPQRARPLFYLGVALSRDGKRDASIDAFRQGLILDPEAKWGLAEYVKYLTKPAATQSEKQYLLELREFINEALLRPPNSSLLAQQHEADKALLTGLLQNVELRLSEIS